jgi:hypothetical protein
MQLQKGDADQSQIQRKSEVILLQLLQRSSRLTAWNRNWLFSEDLDQLALGERGYRETDHLFWSASLIVFDCSAGPFDHHFFDWTVVRKLVNLADGHVKRRLSVNIDCVHLFGPS